MSIFDGGWPEANRSRRSRELGGVVDWAAVAEFAVGPHGVVLDPEVLDDDAGLGQRPHLLPIEALIAEAGVERFHEAILPRTGGGGGAVSSWFIGALGLLLLAKRVRRP